MNEFKCKSLENKLTNYVFILCPIIWYDTLVEVNTISKSLQSINMDLKNSAATLNGFLLFFNNYKNTWFESAKITAKDLVERVGAPTVLLKGTMWTLKIYLFMKLVVNYLLIKKLTFYQDYFLIIVY